MNYQKYTWYNRTAKLDNPETIHQVMSFGELDEIKAMEQEVGMEKILLAYLQHPKKIYSRPVLLFINKYILKNKEPIDERKYLKNTPRNSFSKDQNEIKRRNSSISPSSTLVL